MLLFIIILNNTKKRIIYSYFNDFYHSLLCETFYSLFFNEAVISFIFLTLSSKSPFKVFLYSLRFSTILLISSGITSSKTPVVFWRLLVIFRWSKWQFLHFLSLRFRLNNNHTNPAYRQYCKSNNAFVINRTLFYLFLNHPYKR